jgi:hypothetical protein
MDIGQALSDSLEYAKDAVWGKWVRWILLIVSTIIFPLILGYQLGVYRGKKPAPEPENWGNLFIDGIKLFIIELLYAIPVIIVAVIFIGTGVLVGMRGSPQAWMAAAGTIAVGVLLTLIVAIIVGLIEYMGIVRFARTGSMGEAFNFSAITAHIGKIGWGSYILAIIAVLVVAIIVAGIVSLIPVVGMFLVFIIAPPLMLFIARFVTLLYDSGPTPAA